MATHDNGHTPETRSPRRRVSMEEDYFYEEVMAIPPTARRMSLPPAYAPSSPTSSSTSSLVQDEMMMEDERLPGYSCDLDLEGVFSMKMEIENTTKRAEVRNWHAVFVRLQGTALHFYSVKRDWGLGRTGRSGPRISPDNPPWVRMAGLEKTYTLLHADVGIAADYRKRSYVIRVRAETDQFLLSCIELPNFVRWLDALFAAINVAPAIEDRDFPRDQSIPRIARVRYFRGGPNDSDDNRNGAAVSTLSSWEISPQAVHHSALTSRAATQRPLSSYEEVPNIPSHTTSTSTPPLEPLPSRISTTSYPNEAVMPETGKWRPRHQWTSAHDMVYAKLCYAVLLFRSPRKSNYIIMKGKRWLVDWTTGRMVRVQPPGYAEEQYEVTGPFQVWNTENRRI